ncbi:thiamin biosynthesis ApbE [Lapidilactobacillus dextrinicus DSM 20335]|uniref:FAD:protein FMN transferase n=1 Tax=Lapidilactobacillus dextrinicus DSM 20335 TaxID=1423738 RepID=A0A0R2BJI1_9LACO|nr:FAD:protein FMN transferase [Lapidilactobacillus dextrinicus]KRM78658.1 thiamin biosynthesis ApbE [Lapidilactobacillus dextrinicus DSM 20335]QFG46589.1 FAD:protein FMN transferase [Lapidilactobacillus dextrinicus]
MQIATTTLHLMGTIIRLQVEAANPEALLELASAKLRDYEKRFSANDENSELMQVNHQAGKSGVVVDRELYELIKIGKAQSVAPGSFLNIAIGPLIQEWRVGFADAKMPTDERIKALLRIIDPHKISLTDDSHQVFLQESGMAIDLGGLAKGYFADKIIADFKQAGAKSGLIDLGGNVLTFGPAANHEDGQWRIGIQNPFLPRGNFVTILPTQNQSIVTSGIYERKFKWQGKTYHHIFDSQTGYPSTTDLASLTIVSERSLTGEIWTTRLFGQNAREAIQIINQTPEIEGIAITDDGQIAFSSGIKTQ